MLVKAKAGDVLFATDHKVGCLIYETIDGHRWVFGGVFTKVSRHDLMEAIWAEVRNPESTFNCDDASKMYIACVNLWPSICESRELADRYLEMQALDSTPEGSSMPTLGRILLWFQRLLKTLKQPRGD